MTQAEDKSARKNVLRDERGRFVKRETYGEASLEIAFERQRRISEFDDDKEAIVYSVQLALKERNYREAEEIVERYQAVAKSDLDYQRLLKLTREGSKTYRAIDDLLFKLEATPEDDLIKRRDIYRALTKLDPFNAEYLEAYDEASKVLIAKRAKIKSLRKALTGASKIRRQHPKRGSGISARAWHWVLFFVMSMMYFEVINSLRQSGSSLGLLAICLVAIVITFPPIWRMLYVKSQMLFHPILIVIFNIIVLTYGLGM